MFYTIKLMFAVKHITQAKCPDARYLVKAQSIF